MGFLAYRKSDVQSTKQVNKNYVYWFIEGSGSLPAVLPEEGRNHLLLTGVPSTVKGQSRVNRHTREVLTYRIYDLIYTPACVYAYYFSTKRKFDIAIGLSTCMNVLCLILAGSTRGIGRVGNHLNRKSILTCSNGVLVLLHTLTYIFLKTRELQQCMMFTRALERGRSFSCLYECINALSFKILLYIHISCRIQIQIYEFVI